MPTSLNPSPPAGDSPKEPVTHIDAPTDAKASINLSSGTSLPPVTIEAPEPDERLLTRQGVLQTKCSYKEQREEAFRETRGKPSPSEKNAIYKRIQACSDAENDLECVLQERFVPQHHAAQFLSPRAFFVSSLFRVCSKALPREKALEINLPTPTGRTPIRYSGPELRQPDGRVFLALLHMLRDVQVGTKVKFQPEPVCVALFRRYDGPSRILLRTHIQRLQKGLIISANFSAQLCLGFDYPRLGGWTVALDPHIVEVFRISTEVWLPMQPRLLLSDGLATWLYTYIASQTRLIPTRIAYLRDLCGSEAEDRAFTNTLRLALHSVAATGLIDTGWSLLGGEVRWLKRSGSAAR